MKLGLLTLFTMIYGREQSPSLLDAEAAEQITKVILKAAPPLNRTSTIYDIFRHQKHRRTDRLDPNT